MPPPRCRWEGGHEVGHLASVCWLLCARCGPAAVPCSFPPGPRGKTCAGHTWAPCLCLLVAWASRVGDFDCHHNSDHTPSAPLPRCHPPLLQTLGLQMTGATRASFLIQATLILTPLLSLAAGYRPRRRVWAGCGLALAGALLITAEEAGAASGFGGAGSLLGEEHRGWGMLPGCCQQQGCGPGLCAVLGPGIGSRQMSGGRCRHVGMPGVGNVNRTAPPDPHNSLLNLRRRRRGHPGGSAVLLAGGGAGDR